jgi:hypothetical protein
MSKTTSCARLRVPIQDPSAQSVYNCSMELTLRKLPDYKNHSGRHALITLYPGRAWKTLYLDPGLGTYGVTADRRLVLLPDKDCPMECLDYTGTISISRADKQSELFSLVFERGQLIKGPSPSREA